MLALDGIRVTGTNPNALFRDISLTAPSPGVLFLVGPAGTGKSRLLRTLAETATGAGTQTSSRVLVDGAPPAAIRHLTQRECLPEAAAQAGMPAPERRRRAVLAALECDVPLYLLDEPTAGLDDAGVDAVRTAIARRAQHAAVVMVTHNRRDCLALGGHIALLAGGMLQECAPTSQFFAGPSTRAGRQFVAGGTCALPPPPASPRHGVWWTVPGLLCGMSRPGLVDDAAIQFRYLADHGVRELVCLEDGIEYDTASLRTAGIALRHVPVPDMAPPRFDQAVALCRSTEASLSRGQAVAMHCRGGLGRTGVALAAVLVWFGDDAPNAIARIRAMQPHAIQSPAQLRFVRDFSERVLGWNPAASLGSVDLIPSITS